MGKLTINELLINRGLNNTDEVKFVRHKDSRTKIINGKEEHESLYELYRNESTRNIFLSYQNEQGKEVFKGVDCIVSFIGEEGRLSRFIGVYKIIGLEEERNAQSDFVYKMVELDGFEDIKERVIIDWGSATISWHQWMKNEKEIVEIGVPLNHVQFKGYTNFILDYSQLKNIFNNEYSE